MQVLILGYSHTRAIKSALRARRPQEAEVKFDVAWLLNPDRPHVHGELTAEKAIERVASLSKDDLVVLAIAGEAHGVFGLVRHQRPFEIFESGNETIVLSDDAEVIPERQIWDVFEERNRRTGHMPELLRAASCRVAYLATPPPKQDNNFILEKMLRYAVDYKGRPIAEAGISPPFFRLRLWKLEMRILAHLCAEWGAIFVPAPDGGLTEDGFLSPACYPNDATHGNATYGELVLRQMERIVLDRQICVSA